MSVQAITWVLEHSESRLGDRLVLLSIANHINSDSGVTWISVKTIAKESRMSDRQVQRALKRLEESGELEIDRNSSKNGTHVYHIRGMTNCQGDKLSGVTNRANRGDKSGKKNVRNVTRTVNEPKEPLVITPLYPPGLDVEAWERWLDYRKQIRRPLKSVSIPTAQKALAAFGVDQAAVVNQSIANGWQGLFPLKAKATTSSTKPKSHAEQFHETLKEIARNGL